MVFPVGREKLRLTSQTCPCRRTVRVVEVRPAKCGELTSSPRFFDWVGGYLVPLTYDGADQVQTGRVQRISHSLPSQSSFRTLTYGRLWRAMISSRSQFGIGGLSAQ